jgi:hypothetical protein
MVSSIGGMKMNREEILAKSKQENRGQDIVGLAAARDSMQLGWVVMICLLAAVTVVDAIVFERMNNEVFFVVMAGSAAVFISKYLKLRRKHELVISAGYVILAVVFLVLWILQLVK